MPKVLGTGVVANHRQVPHALVAQCLNEIFGNATQSEAADHDGGAILNVGDGLLKIRNDFIHAPN